MSIKEDFEKAFSHEYAFKQGITPYEYSLMEHSALWGFKLGLEMAAKEAERTPSNGRFAIDSKGKSGIIGGTTIAEAIRSLVKELEK